MIESRVAPRKAINTEGIYSITDEKSAYEGHFFKNENNEMELLDISTSGCAFRTACLLPKGLHLRIQIRKFPVTRKKIDFIVLGETVYCRYHSRTDYRVGIRFMDIEKRLSGIIDSYVRK